MRTMVPERWDTKEPNSTIIPVYLLEKALRLLLRKKNTGGAQTCPWSEQIKLGVWSQEEAIIRMGRISNVSDVKGSEGDSRRENTRIRERVHAIWRSEKEPQWFFSCIWYGRKETTWEKRRSHPNIIRNNAPELYSKEKSSFSTSESEKNLIIHRSIR